MKFYPNEIVYLWERKCISRIFNIWINKNCPNDKKEILTSLIFIFNSFFTRFHQFQSLLPRMQDFSKNSSILEIHDFSTADKMFVNCDSLFMRLKIYFTHSKHLNGQELRKLREENFAVFLPSLVSSLLPKAASMSSNKMMVCWGATANKWLRRSSVSPRSDKFKTQIPRSNSPARAVMKEDFPQPGGPWSKYPRRYGIPTWQRKRNCKYFRNKQELEWFLVSLFGFQPILYTK